jgi:hypothetical protein
MSEKPTPPADTESELQRYREKVTAYLAFLLVGGFIFFFIVTIVILIIAPASFQNAITLMGIITPFVGVAIGYYFNNVSVSGRAEAAERTAQAAASTAQEMTSLRDEAMRQTEAVQAEATVANSQVAEMKDSLQEVTQWANEMAAQVETTAAPGGPGTLSASESGGGSPEAWLKAKVGLQSALARAQKLAGK